MCFENRSRESQKESRLPSLLSYSVVKEPASRKGRQDCQTLPAVSSGMIPFSNELIPSDPDTCTTANCGREKSEGRVLQGPVILGAVRAVVNFAAQGTLITAVKTRLFRCPRS